MILLLIKSMEISGQSTFWKYFSGTQPSEFQVKERRGLSTDSSDDESTPSVQSREGLTKSENTTDDSQKAHSCHDVSNEAKNRTRKSPVKTSTRTKSLQSPTKSHKSPVKTLKSAEARSEGSKSYIVTNRKDTNGGRAYESSSRPGVVENLATSHLNTKHNGTVERTSSSGQWWRVR